MNTPKKILVITTAFYPENEIGVIRMTKIVKYLVRSGHDITVVSPELHMGNRRNPEAPPKEFDHIRHITIPYSTTFKKLFLNRRNSMVKGSSAAKVMNADNKNVLSKVKSVLMRWVQFFYSLLRNKDWSRQVLRSESFKKELDLTYDAVFSSYPSLSAHWIAMKASKQMRVPLICDFRDPINYQMNSNVLFYIINTWLQNRIVKKATFVTTIAQDLFDKFASKDANERDKLKYIPNGYDQDDLNKEDTCVAQSTQQKLQLCYVGSLYGGKRRTEHLFIVLEQLFSEEPQLKNTIEFVYAGKEFTTLEAVARRYNLDHILINKGFVTREESIAIQNNSDIITIVTWNTKKDKGILTGKLFEAFLTKKPTLVLVNGDVPNSEIKSVVASVHGGFVFEEASENFENEIADLKLFLKKAIIQKSTSKDFIWEYNRNRERYSYDKIVNDIIKLL